MSNHQKKKIETSPKAIHNAMKKISNQFEKVNKKKINKQ